jgi:hypothetical protein
MSKRHREKGIGNMKESNIADTVIAIYSADFQRLAKFYEEALDLALVEVGEGYVCLGKNGIEVNILRMNGKPGKVFESGKSFTIREEAAIKCSFLVSSFEHVKNAISTYGGFLKNEDEAWEWRGARHLDGHDPEGNVVQYRVLNSRK